MSLRGAKPKTMQTTPRLRNVYGGLGSLICIAAFGLVLSSCSTNVSSQQQVDRKLEVAVCKLLSPPPPSATGSGTFIAISVKGSLISALNRTGNPSLERVAKDLIAAGKTETHTQNSSPMSRALKEGINACNRLGLRTAASD